MDIIKTISKEAFTILLTNGYLIDDELALELKDAIARSVCADSELLTDEDIKIMAQYVLDTQIKCIGQSIKNIWEKMESR